jgi:hypothetical protein
LAIGIYYEKIITPDKNNLRRYFHGVRNFIGCGTNSKLWFYFDDKHIIINDHKYIYPYDELMKDVYEFVERLDFNSNQTMY